MFDTISRLGATASITIDEAAALLQRLHLDHAILPTHAIDTTAEYVERILSTATAADAVRIGDLLTRSASIISAASGLKNITAFHGDAAAAELHPIRNTLAALAVAAYLADGSDPALAYRKLPQLKLRTHLRQRPLEDDEIILCRIHALHLLRTGSPTQRRVAAAYAAADAGLPPTEATALREPDLVLDGTTPRITMASNRSFQTRSIPLERFHTDFFSEYLNGTHSTLLTCSPRKNLPGSDSAACSMHGVLGRFLKTLGLVGDDLTASSVYQSGLRRILDHTGVTPALSAAGFSDREAAALLKLLGRNTPTPTVAPLTAPEHRGGL